MKEKFYGGFQQTAADDDVARHAEEIAIKGFTVVTGLFASAELETWRQKIDDTYQRQEREFGREQLMALQEVDICRAPILYDFEFLALAAHTRILRVVRHILGPWVILNLQNAIMNRPGARHHQGAWHRDLPYQNFVSSRPLAINALIAIDDFSAASGGTQFLPFSHRTEALPSDAYINRNKTLASAPAGSAVLFDSMLIHCASANETQSVRRAVNHLYSVPIIKQQYDFPRALASRADLSPEVAQLLGLTSQVPLDDRAWRRERALRLKAGR